MMKNLVLVNDGAKYEPPCAKKMFRMLQFAIRIFYNDKKL
tara:strand:+ start:5963 stop:6082 length:120 start_codon:yes stop_codon:yes gene_type:complete